MWSFMSAGLLCLLGVTFPSSVNASRLRRVENDTSISLSLSSAATISHNVSTVPRWSEFKAPSPGTIVNVATEQDVAVTVCSTLLLIEESRLKLCSHESR